MNVRTLAALALPAFAAAARAQTPRDTTLLAPIVVTATRTPVPSTTLANGVTVLRGDDLRRAGITTVVEALRGAPSVAFAQAGSTGAQTSLFLRGGESDYVRVLVDGVPLNQAGGAIDMANLTTENIDRIEIVRGPASVLYGSDAMTGVIQIITRRGGGPARFSADARGGNRGASLGAIEVAGGGGRTAFTAGIQREASNGIYDVNNQVDNTSASARLSLAWDARTDVQLAGRFRSGTFHYPTDGSGKVADSNQFQRSRQLALSLDAGRRVGSRIELRALLGFATTRDSTDDRQDGPGDTTGFAYASESRRLMTREGADLRANIQVAAPILLTAGAAWEHERLSNRSSSQGQFGPFTVPDTIRGRDNAAAYLQALGTHGLLRVQAGLRLDDNQRFGRVLTWRVGASAQVAPATRVRASAGTGFKEPTFDENYTTVFSNGNPNLKPERSTSIEAGLEQAFGARAVLAVTVFAQRFRDLIQYHYSPNPADTNFFNVAAAVASGAEAELRVRTGRGLDLSAQYTWLHTSASDSGFDGSVFAKNQRLLRRPTHSASVAADWHPARVLDVGGRVLYVGDRDDVDFAPFPAARVGLSAYTRCDLWGRVTVVRPEGRRAAVALTWRIDNVANAQYQEVFGFRTPGRRFMAGVQVDGGAASR